MWNLIMSPFHTSVLDLSQDLTGVTPAVGPSVIKEIAMAEVTEIAKKWKEQAESKARQCKITGN